jgi:hypothetical protein
MRPSRFHVETKMNQRTTAIVLTVAVIVLCACPGVFGLFMGGLFAVVSFVPGAEIDMMGSSDPQSALNFGLGGLCGGALLLAVAAAVIYFAWRRQPGSAAPR